MNIENIISALKKKRKNLLKERKEIREIYYQLVDYPIPKPDIIKLCDILEALDISLEKFDEEIKYLI